MLINLRDRRTCFKTTPVVNLGAVCMSKTPRIVSSEAPLIPKKPKPLRYSPYPKNGDKMSVVILSYVQPSPGQTLQNRTLKIEKTPTAGSALENKAEELFNNLSI